MIIALSGLAGSGKSTIKNLLAEKLGIKKYSVGDLRGKMALERGLTIDELNALGMQESFTDKDVDSYQEHLGKTEDNFVIDGWLSWHFIPHAKKIFLTVDPDVGAQRIFSARQHETGREDEPEYASLEAAKEVLANRTANNNTRYQKWYGVDFRDLSQYDLIIDTSYISTAEVVQKIEEFIHS